MAKKELTCLSTSYRSSPEEALARPSPVLCFDGLPDPKNHSPKLEEGVGDVDMAGLEDPPFAGDDSLEDLGVVDLPHDQNDLASGLHPEAAPPPASASTNSPGSIDDFLSSLTDGRSGFWGDTEGLDRAEPRECTFMFLTPYISHNSTGR
jgi:hypothetical protein